MLGTYVGLDHEGLDGLHGSGRLSSRLAGLRLRSMASKGVDVNGDPKKTSLAAVCS